MGEKFDLNAEIVYIPVHGDTGSSPIFRDDAFTSKPAE
jgi:hypothetical protein